MNYHFSTAGVGTDSKVGMMLSLMEALKGGVGAGGVGVPQLLHTAAHPGGVARARGAFRVDTTLQDQVRYIKSSEFDEISSGYVSIYYTTAIFVAVEQNCLPQFCSIMLGGERG